MTIACGFKCLDGVLLGADTLVQDGTIKSYENKIFKCSTEHDHLVCMAGAGNFPRVQEFSSRLRDTQAFSDGKNSTEGLARAIREAARWTWYKEAVEQTRSEGFYLEFLFAVRDTQ